MLTMSAPAYILCPSEADDIVLSHKLGKFRLLTKNFFGGGGPKSIAKLNGGPLQNCPL